MRLSLIIDFIFVSEFRRSFLEEYLCSVDPMLFLNKVSPVKRLLLIKKQVDPGVCPGVWMALT